MISERRYPIHVPAFQLKLSPGTFIYCHKDNNNHAVLKEAPSLYRRCRIFVTELCSQSVSRCNLKLYANFTIMLSSCCQAFTKCCPLLKGAGIQSYNVIEVYEPKPKVQRRSLQVPQCVGKGICNK